LSRGPGRIERAILDQIKSDKAPDRYGRSGVVLISSWDLAYIYQPPSSVDPSGSWHAKNATPAQRKAVIRAMHSFVRKFPQYAIGGGKGRGRLFLYEPGDPLSATWVRRLERTRASAFPYVTLATLIGKGRGRRKPKPPPRRFSRRALKRRGKSRGCPPVAPSSKAMLRRPAAH
jgi:hypothetical protein